MPSSQVALKLLVLLACHTYPSILLLPVSARGRREHLRKSRAPFQIEYTREACWYSSTVPTSCTCELALERTPF